MIPRETCGFPAVFKSTAQFPMHLMICWKILTFFFGQFLNTRSSKNDPKLKKTKQNKLLNHDSHIQFWMFLPGSCSYSKHWVYEAPNQQTEFCCNAWSQSPPAPIWSIWWWPGGDWGVAFRFTYITNSNITALALEASKWNSRTFKQSIYLFF